MTLAVVNISTAIVKAELSETTNAIEGLCTSVNINQWALHKPAFYGTGNDAWTVDTNYDSGFKPALSLPINNFKLGDFRGYDHLAKAPSYYNGNQSYSYYKYETPDGQISISYGQMYYTSNGNAYTPLFHTLDEGASDSLTGIRAEIDSTLFGSVTELTKARSAVNVPNIDYLAGTYTLTAYYYTRISDVSPWVISNVIEGGSVDLVVTELPARFTISNTVIVPSTTTAGTETFDVDFRVTNDTASAIAYTFYWQMSDKNGTIAISVAASSFEDYNQIVFEAATSAPTETWLLRMTDVSGPILANSVKDVTVT